MLRAMRLLLLPLIATISCAAEPVATLVIPDVAALRAHAAGSWWSRAADLPAWAPLAAWWAEGERSRAALCGVDMHRVASAAQRVELAGCDGATLVTARLVVDASCAGLAEEARRRAPGPLDGSAVIYGEARGFPEWIADDVWLMGGAGRILTFANGPQRPPSPDAVLVPGEGVDLRLRLDPARWAEQAAWPQAMALVRGCGLGPLTLDLAFAADGERVDGSMPLRSGLVAPLDPAALAAEVPAGAVSLVAVGLADGGRLWAAAVPGLPLPALVLSLPASPAVDAVLAGDPPQVRGWPWPLTVRRDGARWVLATTPAAAAAAGDPALAQRLAWLPPGAVACAFQDTPAILRQAGGLLAFARLGLPAEQRGAQAFPGGPTLGTLLDLAAGLVAPLAADIPPTRLAAVAAGDGLRISGSGASTALALPPLVFAAWWAVQPQVDPWHATAFGLVAPALRGWLHATPPAPDAVEQLGLVLDHRCDPRLIRPAYAALWHELDGAGRLADGFARWEPGTASEQAGERESALASIASCLSRPAVRGRATEALRAFLTDGVAGSRRAEATLAVAYAGIGWELERSGLGFAPLGVEPLRFGSGSAVPRERMPLPEELLAPFLVQLAATAPELRVQLVEALAGFPYPAAEAAARSYLADDGKGPDSPCVVGDGAARALASLAGPRAAAELEERLSRLESAPLERRAVIVQALLIAGGAVPAEQLDTLLRDGTVRGQLLPFLIRAPAGPLHDRFLDELRQPDSQRVMSAVFAAGRPLPADVCKVLIERAPAFDDGLRNLLRSQAERLLPDPAQREPLLKALSAQEAAAHDAGGF